MMLVRQMHTVNVACFAELVCLEDCSGWGNISVLKSCFGFKEITEETDVICLEIFQKILDFLDSHKFHTQRERDDQVLAQVSKNSHSFE
jgi:hypothetical protein